MIAGLLVALNVCDEEFIIMAENLKKKKRKIEGG